MLWFEKKIKVVERQISIHEVINSYNEGRLIEVFGVSTSSMIRSFSQLAYKEELIDLRDNTDLATYLNNTLIAIREGPKHPWVVNMDD
jgi:hypothetical protein